jgi:NADP-dependent 3-hydroxy acid dehydrogenase YdfG
MTRHPDGPRLRGRVAVVTGASSGVGCAIALRLVAEGATVVAVGRDKTRLEDLLPRAAAGPGFIEPTQVDLTDDVARDDFVARLRAEAPVRGRVDVLVHSAGSYHSGAHAEAPLTDLDAQYAANVRAPYALTQGLLPALRAGGGDIVVVNSSQGMRAGGNTGQFAATQHAMRAVADSLRQEVNSDGIRVCTIHLGRTATPRQEGIYAREGRRYTPELLVAPADVADVVVTALGLPARAEVTEIHLRPAEKSY